MLGAGAVAAYVGTLALSETIKKTQWFKWLTQSAASGVDSAVDIPSKEMAEKFRSGLRRQSRFVSENEPMLRRLAGTREEFQFLRRTLDWLKEHPDEPQPGPETAFEVGAPVGKPLGGTPIGGSALGS